VYGLGHEPDPRFSFANERTFLAWIRTGLGFVAAGVGLATLADLDPGIGQEAIWAAILLIVCGIVSAAGALSRWMRNERAMRLGQPLTSSPILATLTGGLILVALVAFLVVTVE
jgi:putative membrane protein